MFSFPGRNSQLIITSSDARFARHKTRPCPVLYWPLQQIQFQVDRYEPLHCGQFALSEYVEARQHEARKSHSQWTAQQLRFLTLLIDRNPCCPGHGIDIMRTATPADHCTLLANRHLYCRASRYTSSMCEIDMGHHRNHQPGIQNWQHPS